MPTNLNTILFSVPTSGLVPICQNAADPIVNQNVEMPAAAMSSRRPTSGISRGPKISALHLTLYELMVKQNFSVLTSGAGSVYCEVHDGTSSYAFLMHEGVFYTELANISKSAYLLCMLISSLIKNPSQFAETTAYLNEVVLEYKSLTYIPKLKMATLCDCFYYDLKAVLGSAMGVDIVTRPLDVTTLDLVQQSIRTRAMTVPDNHLISTGVTSNFVSYMQRVFTRVDASMVPVSSPATAARSTPASGSSLFHECKMGKYAIGYEWSAEQLKRTRSFDFLDSFIPNDCFDTLVRLASYDLSEVMDRINTGSEGIGAIQDNYINAILVGKPGTGKTTTAEALSAALEMPIYTVKNSKNTEEDTFEGMTKVVEGNFAFRSTPFLEAFENGGIIVLEEFNLADPGLMQGAIGQAIEYPFILMKDGYQEVRRHPLCIIISTMNTATQGTREPNEALTSRSPVTLIMDDPKDEEFLSILKNKGYASKDCRSVYTAYKAIINHLIDVAGSEEMTMQVTLRHCLGALKLMRVGIPAKEAIKKTMIGSIAIKDLELAKDIEKSVINTIRI